MPHAIATGQVGSIMPDLTLVDADGNAGALDDVRGGEVAVIYFMRASVCPVCLRHVRALSSLAESGQLGDARVILIAPGGTDEARRLAGHVDSTRVSPWASGSGHTDAGLGSFLLLQHSGTFVVEADGVVRYRRTSALPIRNFDRRELLQSLAQNPPINAR